MIARSCTKVNGTLHMSKLDCSRRKYGFQKKSQMGELSCKSERKLWQSNKRCSQQRSIVPSSHGHHGRHQKEPMGVLAGASVDRASGCFWSDLLYLLPCSLPPSARGMWIHRFGDSANHMKAILTDNAHRLGMWVIGFARCRLRILYQYPIAGMLLGPLQRSMINA